MEQHSLASFALELHLTMVQPWMQLQLKQPHQDIQVYTVHG